MLRSGHPGLRYQGCFGLAPGNAERRKSFLCCAVLCCAVLCCAVLCCAVLCCAGTAQDCVGQSQELTVLMAQ